MPSKRELFLEKVSTLNQQEKLYLLNIFKKYDIGYSKNTNGYFFNLTHVDDETLDELENYIDLIVSNRKKIEENDTKREQKIMYYKNLLKNEEIKKENEEKELYNQLLKVISNKITFQITKKKKYKQKIINFDTSDEPTQWLIKKKYKKNTIYGRLYNKIKKIRSNNEKKEKEVEDECEEIEIEEGEGEVFGEQDEDFDQEIDTVEIDDTHDTHEAHEVHEVHETDAMQITHDHDTEDIQEIEHDDTEIELEQEHEDTFDEKLKFFKDILSAEGYVFSETIIKLQIEDYI